MPDVPKLTENQWETIFFRLEIEKSQDTVLANLYRFAPKNTKKEKTEQRKNARFLNLFGNKLSIE